MATFIKQRPLRPGYIASVRGRKSVLSEMLLQDGINLDRPKIFAVFLKLSPAQILTYDITFIDLSSLDGIRDVVGTLIALRVEYPSVPDALISNTFVNDDFGISRKSIGDVSLRSPISASSLEIGCRQNLP